MGYYPVKFQAEPSSLHPRQRLGTKRVPQKQVNFLGRSASPCPQTQRIAMNPLVVDPPCRSLQLHRRDLRKTSWIKRKVGNSVFLPKINEKTLIVDCSCDWLVSNPTKSDYLFSNHSLSRYLVRGCLHTVEMC